MQKQSVWKSVYGKAPYKDVSLRRDCSQLLQLAYQFVAVERTQDQEERVLLSNLDYAKTPKLDKHFRGLDRKFTGLQQSKAQPSRQQFEALFEYHSIQHQRQEERGEKLDNFKQLEQADYYLDCHYYLQKLRHYCDALGYQNFMARKPDIQVPENFLDQLAATPIVQQEAWVRAYYLTARMLSAEDGEAWFFQLKSLLFEEVDAFPREEANTLCIHLSNYCIDKKINFGEAHFFQELFDVYRRAIESGLLLKNGVLGHQDYKNIITVGLHVEQFDWVEHFIQQYTQLLPPENQENALTYNLAKVYFSRQEYEKVIEQLREVEYQSQVYALGSKLMLLRTYFEMGEFLALDSLVDSFRIYLRRDRQISREVKQQYMNLIRFTRRLSRLAPGDQSSLQKIEQQVEDCKALAAKKWVQEKIAELK